MSYILDALRKSEEERRRGKVPDFSASVDAPVSARKKNNVWPIITLVVVAINAGLILFFWNQPASVSPSSADEEAALAQEEEVEAAQPAEVVEKKQVPNAAYMPQLDELPDDQRMGIPDLSFSSHMYSSRPEFRSIIINGKRLKEGQHFNRELQVVEITDSGVILSNGRTEFEVDILGRWAE